MSPARRPRSAGARVPLLIVDPSARAIADASLADLPRLLSPGDLLVVNDAATLPASLSAIAPDGAACELRLLGMHEGEHWHAVLLGAGDWRTRTEHRPPPPVLGAGATLRLGELSDGGFHARILEVSATSPRLVTVGFDRRGARLWEALYACGRPIQYAHLDAPLALWSVQTPYASRPWAVEPPSAGLALSWRLLSELRAAGIEIGWLTHAAGVSATGDPAIDARLPLAERYDIPARTVEAVARARRRRGAVVAVGTTVVRALEGCARDRGELVAGSGITALRLGPADRPRIVDGLLTGMHEPSESHYALVGAFAPAPLLASALAHAVAAGYQGHEFGDATLVLDGASRALTTTERRPSGSEGSARRSRPRAQAS